MSSRIAIAAGAAGLAGGLALGVTGFASAADPTPSPSSGATQQDRHDKGFNREHGFGHRFGGPGHAFGKHRGAGGLVQSVDSGSLTVLTHDGTKTIALNDDTSYYVGKARASKSAVTKGLVVGIRLVDPQADRPVAAVVRVVPAHVAGWVTDIDGSTITVTDLSGFTRTIRTDSATTYVKDGSTATSAIVTKGALIRAVGQVAEDGTTLEADRITVGRHGDRMPRMEPEPGDRPDA